MSRAMRVFGWMLLAMLVVAALLAGAAAVGWNEFVAGSKVTVDGESIRLGAIEGRHTLLVLSLAMLASFIVTVVVTVVITVALLASIVAILATALSTALTLAIVASPFLLIGWLVWRRSPRATTPASPKAA